MGKPSDIEARVSALETRIEEVAADATAARHLAAAHDRDLADLGVKVDANRKAINALGVQTAERFDRLERRFDGLEARFDTLETRFDTLEGRFDALETRFDTLETRFDTLETRFDTLETRFDALEGRVDRLEGHVDRGFAEMRHKFDQAAAGQQRIVELLTGLIERDGG